MPRGVLTAKQISRICRQRSNFRAFSVLICEMQGYLTKPNRNIGSKKRFFVLNRCTLTYYNDHECGSEKLADIFLNAQTRVSAAGAQQLNIENVSVGTKTSVKTSYILLCDTAQQRDQWVAALKSACGIEEAERVEAQQEQARVDAKRRESEERASKAKALQQEAKAKERLTEQEEAKTKERLTEQEEAKAKERLTEQEEAKAKERLTEQADQLKIDAERSKTVADAGVGSVATSVADSGSDYESDSVSEADFASACPDPAAQASATSAQQPADDDWAALKRDGYTAVELMNAGCSFAELMAIEYHLPTLKAAGFKIADFRAAGCDWAAIQKAGFNAAQATAAGCDFATVQSSGYDLTPLAVQRRHEGCGLNDMRAAGFSLPTLKAAGYDAAAFRAAECDWADMKTAGFVARELRPLGCSLTALVALQFDAHSLFSAGFNYDAVIGAGHDGSGVVLVRCAPHTRTWHTVTGASPNAPIPILPPLSATNTST